MRKGKIKLLNYRPLPIMFLVGIVGILAVSLLDFVVPIILLCVLIMLLAVMLAIKKFRKYALRVLLVLLTFLVFILVCGGVMSKAKELQPPIYSATITGTVNSATRVIESDEDTTKYLIVLTDVSYVTNNESGELDGKASGYVDIATYKIIEVGYRIVLKADIKPRASNLSDRVKVYGKWASDIAYDLSSLIYVDVIPKAPSFHEGMKVAIKDNLTAYVPSGGVIYSMLFGDKSTMESDFVSASRKTGIAHLFAVSGLHLGLVASIVGYITKKCKASKWIDFVVVVLLSGIYAYLVGFGVSVARAFLMLIVYKLGKIFGLRRCGISSLSLSAMIILLVNPLALFDVSFQLSVMAIVGILFFERPLSKIIKTRWKGFNAFVAVNLSVNIALLPIMLHYFGSVSLIFLLANLLVVPIVTLMFPMVFMFVLLSALLPQIAYLIVPFGYVFSLIEMAITAIAAVPFLSVNIKLNVLLMIGYIVIILLISTYSMLPKRGKAVIAVLLCFAIITTSLLTSFGRLDGSSQLQTIVSSETNYILMLDVENKHYLIINGKLTRTDVYSCASYAYRNNIEKVEGIVKLTFDGEEKELLLDLKGRLKINSVITYEQDEGMQDIFSEKVYYTKTQGNCQIIPFTEKVLQLKLNGIKVSLINIAEDLEVIPVDTEILYCVGELQTEILQSVKYYVNDRAVIDNKPNAVGTNNMFVLNKGKIKII